MRSALCPLGLGAILYLTAALGAPAHAQVSGIVVDQSTLLPLSDVIVTLQTTTTSTVTAPDGTFDLPGAVGVTRFEGVPASADGRECVPLPQIRDRRL